jgi:hypothetical protein
MPHYEVLRYLCGAEVRTSDFYVILLQPHRLSFDCNDEREPETKKASSCMRALLPEEAESIAIVCWRKFQVRDTDINKCDHEYPCNNCVRRRLPENCSYSRATHDEERPKSRPRREINFQRQLPEESLANSMGYFEGSKSNLLSLMKKHHLLDEDDTGNDTTEAIPAKLLPEMNTCFQLFPKRPVLNSLVQLFFEKVNWIYEMMHPTLFLGRYEKWWRTVPGSTSESLHFSILILRVCAYSAQFFPVSTVETGILSENNLLGVPVDRIRGHCHELASRLQRLCEQLSGPKSLIWVQQLFYAACYEQNEGGIKRAWYMLGNAIRVVEDLGLHVEDTSIRKRGMNDLEYDMGRRAFWNLYIRDRFLALVLDRAPCIVDSHCSTDLPKMRLLNPVFDAAAPDVFTERMLQAKLSKLWSSLSPSTPYDPVTAEESYEKLCRSFIAQLPRAFDVHAPDTQWDAKLPNLCRQRQTLRIAIFVGVCQIFQPLLSLDADQVEALLQYKRDLVARHREQLVRSAIQVLSSVMELQQLMGGGPQRFFMLSLCTFQAAILLCLHLLTLDSSQQALVQGEARRKQPVLVGRPTDVFGDTEGASPHRCRQHVEHALRVLLSSQDISTIAKVGARKLEQVLVKLDAAAVTTTSCSLPTAVLAVADGAATNDWLGFEMQQLTDTEEGQGVEDYVHAYVPTDVDVEDGAWGSKAFAQWMAGEDSVHPL